MSLFANNLMLFMYVITIIYFVIMGCYMLAYRGNPIVTHGEQKSLMRMTRSVGAFILFNAFDWLIYMLPMLYTNDVYSIGYDICFLITMMLETPLLFGMMHAVVQKRVDVLRWFCVVASPFALSLVWYLVMPVELSGRVPVYFSGVLNIMFVAFLLIKYSKEYHVYVQRIKSEYSDLSNREIFWAWSSFAGFAIQAIIFIIYMYYWVPELSLPYWALSILNCAYICYCVCRQKPLDSDVVEEEAENESNVMKELGMVEEVAKKADENPYTETVIEKKNEEKAFYAVIEKKLETLCEEKLLFLDPDLTRETLCHRLSISSTYLKMYFRSRDLSFYQYINMLRVEYADRLMTEKPDMPVYEVCEKSGFRSQTTFRKVFKEVMGCLPSEVRCKRPDAADSDDSQMHNPEF